MNDETDEIPPRESDPAEVAPPLHELSEHAQRRNSLVFIVNTSITYFVAPVFYIGLLHAAIVNALGYKDTIANLPESVFMAMLPLPIFIAWIWPSTGHLRKMLVVNYFCKGTAGLVTACLFLAVPPSWQVAALVLHAAVVGVTNGVTNMCLWELIGRGMSSVRRGWTLGIAFGVGPLFAVLGSCVSQLVLNGNFLGIIEVDPLPKPWSYAALFAATGPAMFVSAAMVFLAHLPPPAAAEPAVGFAEVKRGLRQYFTHPLILIAVCGFLLTSAGGNMILNNVALYVRDATGEAPEAYTGLQQALRYGCKSLFGLTLGFVLARSQPKTPALATTLICLAGVSWALFVPGKWYLLSTGLLGAGELYYVYYLNYIVACSPPERIRENTAYTNVIASAVSAMPLIYGWISDHHGLRSSFQLAAAILVAAIVIVSLLLPPRPAPRIVRSTES